MAIDYQELVRQLADVTTLIPGTQERGKARKALQRVLELVGCPDFETMGGILSGHAPRFKVPASRAYAQRSERMSESQTLAAPERALTRTMFVWLEWTNVENDPGITTTYALAAEELGMKPETFMAQYRRASGKFCEERIHPLTGRIEEVVVTSLRFQPIGAEAKRLLLNSAEERLVAIREHRRRPKGLRPITRNRY